MSSKWYRSAMLASSGVHGRTEKLPGSMECLLRFLVGIVVMGMGYMLMAET